MENKVGNHSLVRVRMAPSPTGYLHLGSMRAAIFNWLFARHHNGVFLIRIEDTDLERSKPEYVASILESFEWCSIIPDEPIVIQSERIQRHKEVANKLLEAGNAYKCYCTAQELEERLGAGAMQEGNYKHYDRKCLSEQNRPENTNKPYAIRFKVPDLNEIGFDDLIHGKIEFAMDQFDDFIIVRSDATPMYNFVVVVDDADMRISHVIRGDDHIPNTPKQILLYRACGFEIPKFAHLPLILGPSGNKLSKRDAATATIDYRKNGFLADALFNYLVRLGWSHGDQEVFTKDEMIKYFTLDTVGKKGSIFDIKKLEWMNTVYIKKHSAPELLNFIQRDVDSSFVDRLSGWDIKNINKWIDLYKERVKTLKELTQEIELVYQGSKEFKSEEIDIWKTDITRSNMQRLKESLMLHEDFSSQSLQELIKTMCTQLGIALPDMAKPLRIALTGKSSSPGVFEILSLLGKDESIKRLQYFMESIKA